MAGLRIIPLRNKQSPMRIAILSSEVVPFAKTGGLADVAGALPKALAQHDVDARVILPLHGVFLSSGGER